MLQRTDRRNKLTEKNKLLVWKQVERKFAFNVNRENTARDVNCE